MAEKVRYQHTDYQGTVVAQTDAARQILSRSVYDSYGAPQDAGNNGGPGYTGHLQDAQTGLTYMQQRYYDPLLARFLSVDPVAADVGSGGNFNRYGYANNNPVRFTDPDGRCPDGMCGQMLSAHVKWRMAHPNAPADGLEKIDIGGTVAMAGVTAAVAAGPELVAAGFRSAGRWVVRKFLYRAVSKDDVAEATKNITRTKKVKPIKDANGPHTTWKTDPQTGQITRHETWNPNPRNPTGWDKVQSTDLKGAPHINKQTGEAIPTPHTQGKGIPGGVRPASPSEIPIGNHYNY